MNFKEALIAHLQGERVEVREGDGYSWQDFGDYYSHTHLQTLTAKGYADGYKFQIKPRTITVNGREIVAGESEAPAGNFYAADPLQDDFCMKYRWTDDKSDNRLLQRGLVHLTKENAIAHAKAMLGID